jgi:hypothetical protein
MTTTIAEPQLVRWAPKDGMPPGITINSAQGTFIAWDALKEELEKKLFIQVKNIPVGSSAVLDELYGRKGWIVKIMSPDNQELGHVWAGVDPLEAWKEDGLIRIGKSISDGKAEVWQVFQRFNDDTYHRIKSYV